jgi:hypothetical protein
MRHIDPPKYFRPALAEALQEYRDSVPDIVMLHYGDNDEWAFAIVEIKYCRDTDPTPQQERAAAQHAALKDLILEHDDRAEVSIVTLTLGASGVVYESFMSKMRELGVRGSALTSLARRLHFMAVRNLKMIWAQLSAILQNNSKRPKCKGKRDNTQKRSHKKHGKPAQRGEHHKASKGTKRHHSQSEPAHRKRRKKR